MTKENNLVYYEDVTIRRSSKSVIVNLEFDGDDFYIRNLIIEEIAMKGNADENLIAIILAYIEHSRRDRNVDENPRIRRVENRVLSSVLVELLKVHSAEELIDIFKQLKWHEIADILASDNPVFEIVKYV